MPVRGLRLPFGHQRAGFVGALMRCVGHRIGEIKRGAGCDARPAQPASNATFTAGAVGLLFDRMPGGGAHLAQVTPLV
jgi:hypothetical protein